MTSHYKGILCILLFTIFLVFTVNIFATSPWTKIIDKGFGDPNNWYVMNTILFQDGLFIGTYNRTTGCEIWRTLDGIRWNQCNMDGFGDVSNKGIYSSAVFQDHLYVGTDSVSGCEVWRSRDGITWERSNIKGFGNPQNLAVIAMTPFKEYLYAITYSESEFQLYRTNSGRLWKQIDQRGLSTADNKSIDAVIEFQGYLYLGMRNLRAGTEIYRSSDGVNWNRVMLSGFGDPDNFTINDFVIFEDNLYAGTFNKIAGCEIWASSDGLHWNQVNTDGFGNIFNVGIHDLYSDDRNLYATTRNAQQGGEIWRTSGQSWIQMDAGGFGDDDNYGITTLLVYRNLYYAGTYNWDGCQLWRIEQSKQELRKPLPSLKPPSLFAQLPASPTPYPTFTPFPTATKYPTYTPLATYTPQSYPRQQPVVEKEPPQQPPRPTPMTTPLFSAPEDDPYKKWYESQKELYKITPTPYTLYREQPPISQEVYEEPAEESFPEDDGSGKIVFYIHDSFINPEEKAWDDHWSNSKVQPPGEFMDLYPPTRTQPSKTLLSQFTTHYAYLDPPMEGRFEPGNFILMLWLGNPNARIDVDIQITLAVVDSNGKTPQVIAVNSRKCKTVSPGPAPFNITLPAKKLILLRKHRLRISAGLLDSRLDLPYLYWDSPNAGLTRLIVPASAPTLMKFDPDSRNFTPDTNILD